MWCATAKSVQVPRLKPSLIFFLFLSSMFPGPIAFFLANKARVMGLRRVRICFSVLVLTRRSVLGIVSAVYIKDFLVY